MRVFYWKYGKHIDPDEHFRVCLSFGRYHFGVYRRKKLDWQKKWL